jgi:hypothetical protein
LLVSNVFIFFFFFFFFFGIDCLLSHALGAKSEAGTGTSLVTSTTVGAKEGEGLVLSQRDKEILFKGAIERTYSNDEPIVVV